MISYNEFAEVPQSGLICVEEGTLLRIYYDIELYMQPDADGAETAAGDHPDVYLCQNVDVEGRTYGDIVSAIVNDRYSADDVQALQANYIEARDADSALSEEKREEYLAEYADFQRFRKKAKAIANDVITILNQ